MTESWLVATEDAVRVAREHAREVDAEARFPSEAMEALRRTGLLGLLVPVAHGGRGGGLEDMVEIVGRLADGCLSTALIWAMHCLQVDALVRHGGPELRDQLLPRIAKEGHLLASVTIEAVKGGHLLRSAPGHHCPPHGGRHPVLRRRQYPHHRPPSRRVPPDPGLPYQWIERP
ncbi:acyl-CoA dehydrogenase family protein [Streptomyces sp. NPDC058001]|uniref:acyl-CoA dehydrogenase family protein n=1 Tax=Streptomyces sp. NPDC058001 TaxID=3346300 RepID=UPI0036F04B29